MSDSRLLTEAERAAMECATSDLHAEIDTFLADKPRSKRQIKSAYLSGEIGLSDAVPELMFDHAMERGQAFRYLGL